jgi:hypothetical protein
VSYRSSLGTAWQRLLSFRVQQGRLSSLAGGYQLCKLLGFRFRRLLASLAGVCLTTELGVAWLQSPNKGYSSRSCGSSTALHNHRLQTVLLRRRPPHQNPGPPFSDYYSLTTRLSRESRSQELLCDWRFTANQFILTLSLFRLTARVIFWHLNPCGHSPYVTSSVTRGWVGLLWICLAFVKGTYRTYSMLFEIFPFAQYKSPLSVQAL